MIDFGKLLHDKKSVSFLSFLIGMGITVLMFHKPFVSSRFLSLPIATIENKVVKHGDKCYIYKSQDVKCSHEKTV